MTIEAAIVNQLLATSAVTALAGDRIYPVIMPEDTLFPAVTFQTISDPPIHKMTADSDLRQPLVQIDCWAKNSYGEAAAIAAAIQAVFQDFSGVMGGSGGPTVQRAFLEDRRDGFEANGPYFRVSMDFIIWYAG